jgi:hypothetical protein
MKKMLPTLMLFCFFWTTAAPVFSPRTALAQFVDQNTQDSNVKVVEKTDSFDTIVGVINFLFALVFLFSVIGFIYAGVRFIIAGGSEGILEKANRTWSQPDMGKFPHRTGALVGRLHHPQHR